MSFPLRRSRVLLAGAALGAATLLLFGLRAVRGPAVDVARVTRTDLLETLVVSGRVLERSKASLGSPVTGTVAEVLFEEGDRVRPGQLLVRLDEAEALASLAEARARLEQVSGSGRRIAGEELRQATLRLEQAERDLERLAALRRDGFVSARDEDDARSARDVAASAVASARERVRAIAAGGADERAARAAVASAAARLEQRRVVAPGPGVVLLRSVEPGDVVAAGKVLLTLALEHETWLLAQPDEKNLPSLRVGQAARATADAFPERPFDAEVISIAPGIDLARGTVDVKLRVPDPPDFLRSDLTLSIELEVGARPRALVVPLASVRDAATEPWVLVVRRGRAVRVPVVLGSRGGAVAEVLRGLEEGELVVREPDRVAAGGRVRARPAPGS
ncbi:MAG TPA: efflux RND transporter periplasmic adaptor subunit [Thermoanaerobaculia bacterium]|nr:efflux RND transporter periplasmic adaptor subunit [Thermoanaerobaculia bacterium]